MFETTNQHMSICLSSFQPRPSADYAQRSRKGKGLSQVTASQGHTQEISLCRKYGENVQKIDLLVFTLWDKNMFCIYLGLGFRKDRTNKPVRFRNKPINNLD